MSTERICQYSGNICQAEAVLRKIDPMAADKLVADYCNGKRQDCDQYKKNKMERIGTKYALGKIIDGLEILWNETKPSGV